ncbi:MAG TPA: hypothetical protein VGR57_16845, partial [Ktedonobacterales bacterium]|nr:hypothetical protein [Ktedonobacterales bacterium]
DGVVAPGGAPLFVQIAQVTLWAFMAVGVVGMAYLLSVLAPFHWSQGHRIQAIFCGVGVLVATAITTWNSLAFRSTHFQAFATDRWVDSIWPQLHTISLTMILVAIAPPFWGLFWALVQPTQTNRSLRQMQDGHAEHLLRVQQEAEIKRAKAEANAAVRAAQLRGMARTAATAREEVGALVKRRATGEFPVVDADPTQSDESGPDSGEMLALPGDSSGSAPIPGRVVPMQPHRSAPVREGTTGRGVQFHHNIGAPSAAPVRSAPATGLPSAAQPALISEVDPSDPALRPGWRPVPGDGIKNFFPDDEPATGTTGPRPAARRPGDNSRLFLGISEDITMQGINAVQEVYDEMSQEASATGKKAAPRREIIARLAQKQHIDQATATTLVDQWTKARKNGRARQ